MARFCRFPAHFFIRSETKNVSICPNPGMTVKNSTVTPTVDGFSNIPGHQLNGIS